MASRCSTAVSTCQCSMSPRTAELNKNAMAPPLGAWQLGTHLPERTGRFAYTAPNPEGALSLLANSMRLHGYSRNSGIASQGGPDEHGIENGLASTFKTPGCTAIPSIEICERWLTWPNFSYYLPFTRDGKKPVMNTGDRVWALCRPKCAEQNITCDAPALCRVDVWKGDTREGREVEVKLPP